MNEMTKNVFEGPARSFTIEADDGRVATTFAACAFYALANARRLWPDARSWSWREVPK